MTDSRQEKYERFRSALVAPYDKDPSGTFPIFTTEKHFNLDEYLAESANGTVDVFDETAAALPDELFMDLGCGRRDKTLDNILYVEVYPSVSADLIVEPNCRYPVKDGTLRGIGCFAVLEHTRQPWLVVQEMHRMLKPGGQVWIDWPFLQPIHGFPSHYFNATREGLTSIFSDQGFEINSAFTGRHQTAAYTIGWILGSFAHNLPPDLRAEFLDMRVEDLCGLPYQDPRWWRFLDALPPEAQSELACGNMLFATKT